MELVYIWIDKFRNYIETEINLSDRFEIKFCKQSGKIEIVKNKFYKSIYPEYITNINAIVGKNSVGKTNLVDIIGLRKKDRNKNNAEFEIKYKSNKDSWSFHKLSDIESELKNSIYFFVYYFRKDSKTKEDLFIVEGNDIESFYNMFETHKEIKEKYWLEKYWFSFICTYDGDKFVYKYNIDVKLGEYETKTVDNEIRVYGDYKSEQDKLGIISIREILNPKYFDSYSLKDDDESRIMVPRRIATFKPKYVNSKINMLYNQITNPNSQMYNDERYTLTIEYSDSSLKGSYLEDYEFLKLKHSYESTEGKERSIYRLLESYIKNVFDSFRSEKSNNIEKENEFQKCKEKIENYTIEISDSNFFKNYYDGLLKIITEYMITDVDDKKHIISCYEKLVKVLFNNDAYVFGKNNILIDIKEKIDIKGINEVLNATVDEGMSIESRDTFSVFNSFFTYSISDLSDGESAYLGMFASIYEQITDLAKGKERYIVSLDEPETRMHPELARNFLSELIKFLGDIKIEGQLFQIIISTHSPFILSDLPKENIVFLEKDVNGKCKVTKKRIDTFGQNIHMLLKNGFFMNSTIGEYAKTEINDIISAIQPQKSKSSANKIYPTIQQISKRYPKFKTFDDVEFAIQIIGESVVKDKLYDMFDMCKYQGYSKKANKERLEKKIDRLKEEMKIYE